MSDDVESGQHGRLVTRGGPGWLDGPTFDASLVLVPLLLGLAAGTAVVARPGLWTPILVLDLWLLGYHHVAATFTRLAFDRRSRAEHRALLTWVPLAVIGVVAALGLGVGTWTIVTIYFYWQWWHYTRQSWGVFRVYEKKNGGSPEPELVSKAAIYLLPLWGVLHRSAQAPDEFLGLDVRFLPVPSWLPPMVGVLAVGSIAVSGGFRARAALRGRLPVMPTLYLFTHLVIFAVGYLVIDDIDYGWLTINVWHNAQYLAFVWFFNAKRFEGGPTEESPMLSKISQRDRWLQYTLVTFGISTVAYVVLGVASTALASTIILYQIVNFHHYIVDSVIWKVRKKPMQTTLGLDRS